MDHERRCFTVTWRFENYNFCYADEESYYDSPLFIIPSIKDISWKFKIYPKSLVHKEHINFCVRWIGRLTNLKLDYEISVFGDNSSLPLYEGHSHMDPALNYSSCLVPYHEVYNKKRGVYRLPKTVTIRCRIFKSEVPFTYSGQCFVRTRIRVEKTAFIGFTEKFSSVVPDEKRTLSIKSFSAEEPLFTLKLSLDGGLCCKERIWIEIIPNKKDDVKFCKCKIFLLDVKGTKIECGRNEILFSKKEPQEWKFPLSFTKGYLMMKNNEFLSNDTLTLKCKFSFSTDIEYEAIEDSEFGDIAVVNKRQFHKIPSALEDMTCLYKEGILCDLKLRTETETFNVHKTVLCARSTVFKSMFTTDMKEKIDDCVTIEDIEADIVRLMLLFFYSDKVEDLDWERAKRLYVAADKYDIVALKYRCSDFLKSNLLPSNSCDLLLLSDTHQDEELKKDVQQYIIEHHEKILQTDQWMNLEKTNSQLTIQTFRALYQRNLKN